MDTDGQQLAVGGRRMADRRCYLNGMESLCSCLRLESSVACSEDQTVFLSFWIISRTLTGADTFPHKKVPLRNRGTDETRNTNRNGTLVEVQLELIIRRCY